MVIEASLDWMAAFDRQDLTIAIKKFIDFGVRPSLIPADNYQTQDHLTFISNWSEENLDEAKCNYMVFIGSKEDFATRLKVNNCKIDQIHVSKILGVWISEDLSWDRNIKEICRKAFSRTQICWSQHRRLDRNLHSIYKKHY